MAGIDGFTGWIGTVLGTPDPVGLGRFYAGLTGGELDDRDSSFVTLHRTGTTYLAFQLEQDHRPPVWPTPGSGDQQMQIHLDVGVSDLATAVAAAETLGATQAPVQPQSDVRVMLDPAGHPFCLYLDEG